MTPYASLDPFDALRLAKKEALEVVKTGNVPLSPVLSLAGVLDENKDRAKIMDLCFAYLSKCKFYYLSNHPEAQNSKGITQELVWAMELGIKPLNANLFSN